MSGRPASPACPTDARSAPPGASRRRPSPQRGRRCGCWSSGAPRRAQRVRPIKPASLRRGGQARPNGQGGVSAREPWPALCRRTHRPAAPGNSRIQAHALQPHRVTTFKFTTDPQAEAKIHDVVGLYLQPPTNAVVVSVDEKTQIQALSRTQPLLPLRPGLPARQTHDYQRNGLTSLYAALEIRSGRVLGACAPRHTGADFLRFIKRVARRYRGRDLHVVLDNSSTHSTPAVQTWLAQHPEVQFHFTPKGASWLNMVEAWFGIFTRKSVRRGSFDTVRALIRHIEAYIAAWNSHPTPFVWTKDPAAIVKKALGRGR